jgi:ComF family protein
LNSINTFQKTKTFILDTLFPISCIGCGKPDVWLCDECLAKIPLKLEQVCPLCERATTPDGRVCFSCRKKSSLDGLFVASSYKNELVASAVHYFKYRFVEDLSVPLAKILTKAILGSQLPLTDFIIPVPLHKRRLRWRGFNQTELLADYLGKNLTPGFEIPAASTLLIRSRYTHPQMEIKNYFRRKENLKEAFTISISKKSDIKSYSNLYQTENKDFLRDKTILLVDDIATTGATLFECAKTLKQNGAKVVFAAVIARQEYRKG